jgi:putative two-component system response regulator
MGKILVVEDTVSIQMLVKLLLTDLGHEVILANNGVEGYEKFQSKKPDLVVTDVKMPLMDGFQLCKKIKENPETRLMPVVIITALDDDESQIKGIEAGADDFLTKPFNRNIFQARIRTSLKIADLNKKLDDSWSVLFSLAKAVEAKDDLTGKHTERVAILARKFGKALGMKESEVEQLYISGYIHDIGKIGIPDNILSKPDKLTPEEYEIIKTHPTIGKDICAPLHSMTDVAEVVYSHHEKCDGSGYPNGLTGKEITTMTKIVAICDIYDSLMMKRPYRDAMNIEQVKEIFSKMKGNHVDQELYDFFWGKLMKK